MTRLWYLLVFLTQIGFSQDQVKFLTISIEPYKSLTNGAFFKSFTLESKDCSIEYLEGLEFEWGYRYKVVVKETQLQNPPEDGSSVEYELVELLEKEKVSLDYTFSMIIQGFDELLDREVFICEQSGENSFNYRGEIEIFLTNGTASEFLEELKEKKYLKKSFHFEESGRLIMD